MDSSSSPPLLPLIPTFSTKDSCLSECTSFVSFCSSSQLAGGGFVCQIDVSLFVLVIFAAVFIGVLVPVSCLAAYILGCCSGKRTWGAASEELTRLNTTKLQSAAATDSDSLPQQKKTSLMIVPTERRTPGQKRAHFKSAGSVA